MRVERRNPIAADKIDRRASWTRRGCRQEIDDAAPQRRKFSSASQSFYARAPRAALLASPPAASRSRRSPDGVEPSAKRAVVMRRIAGQDHPIGGEAIRARSRASAGGPYSVA